MICYYHDDLDGHACAAIIRYYHEQQKQSEPLKLIEVHHGYKPNLKSIKHNETVFICDFTFSKEEMKHINENITENLIWIDHHATAIEQNKELRLKGKYNKNFSACELAWLYLFDMNTPGVIQLIGDCDINAGKGFGGNAKLFKLGFELYETNPKYDMAWKYWKGLLGPDEYTTEYYIQKARDISRHLSQQNQKYVTYNAFYATFHGLRAICCNFSLTSSDFFATVDPETYDIAILFVFDGVKYKYSLYSHNPSIKCGQIAKCYDRNGGGHDYAAGFVHYDFLPQYEEKYGKFK